MVEKKTIVVSEIRGDLGIIITKKVIVITGLVEYVNLANYRKYMSKKYMKAHSSKKRVCFVFRGG